MKNSEKAPDVIDMAAQAWMKALFLFAEAQPGGHVRRGASGTSELVTTAPMPFLNGVISTAREADAEEITAFAASPHLRSVPWSVQVRGEEVDERIVATASGHGLRTRMEMPFMLKGLGEGDLRGFPDDGVNVRRVMSDESALYRTTMAAGYEGPEEIFSIFVTRSLMEHVSMRAYVTEAEGVPVATSFGVQVDDLVGVFNIAVPPRHRRRGYGTAATAAVLSDAYENGARTAFLHASPMGVPLYQAMGFRLAESWTVFVP
ncbi:GNAT family N-acetyltransferase [Streptomyces sp. NPDC059717]|uniref:GNAT family N-acetyltransferase n=1 Tax=Streptomyces sp. NPDC059717 TaxID=3346922 RepID=UPI0036C67FA0